MSTLTETPVAAGTGAAVSAGSLLIVGIPADTHVGGHFARAARPMVERTQTCDFSDAYRAPRVLRTLNWRLRGHRPTHLTAFSRRLVDLCERERPTWLLATGMAAIDRDALQAIGRLGAVRINFLTDDPWSPVSRAPWFLAGLNEYDHVFSPRTANLEELRQAGCGAVHYLPFGYAPDIHFPEPPDTAEEESRFGSDVAFVGGADAERVPWMKELADAGLSLALYGGYWDRDRATARFARGNADARTARKAIGGAKVALGLVRRSNRDGHSMRSFETPAIGACMVVEDTAEHRALFGPDGDAVLYVNTPAEARHAIGRLLGEPETRRRLRDRLYSLITGGHHTYADRLHSILTTVAAHG